MAMLVPSLALIRIPAASLFTKFEDTAGEIEAHGNPPSTNVAIWDALAICPLGVGYELHHNLSAVSKQ